MATYSDKATPIDIVVIDDVEFRVVMWTDFKLEESFLDVLGSLSLTVKPTSEFFKEYFERLRKGKIVQLTVGGYTQFTGVIMTQSTSIDRGGVTITVNCSGMLAAAKEASVSPRVNLSSKVPVSVSDFIESNLGPYFGLKYLEVQNDSGLDLVARTGKPISGLPPAVPFESIKEKELKARDSETVYGFCQRIISRYGLILKTTATGQLLLDRPIYDSEALYSLVQSNTISAAGDYMLDGISITDTNRSQFSEVVVRGAAPRARGSKAENKKVKDPKTGKETVVKVAKQGTRAAQPYARVVDKYNIDPYEIADAGKKYGYAPGYFDKWEPLVLPYRNVPKFTMEENLGDRELARHRYKSEIQFFKPKYIEDKKSGSVDRCRNWAEMAMGVRNSTGYVLKCSVNGFFSTTGYLWTPNTVANVIMDYLGINEQMWIYGRSFNCSRGSGQNTQLILMPLNSLYIGKLP